MLEYQTPSAGSHYGPSRHRSDGATANNGGSPASQYGYSRFTSFDGSHVNRSFAQLSASQQQLQTPFYNKLLPDWDSRKVIPKPTDSLLARLCRKLPPTDKQPSMKPVNEMWKTFKHTFHGEVTESWAKHIDKLENEVFEPNSFTPKQCYYAIRKTLRSKAQKHIEDMERGTAKPNWVACIPSWYSADNQDLNRMLRHQPFVSFSYPLRTAIIIVHFHRKFQKGGARLAYDTFASATQKPQETLDEWASRLEDYENEVKLYGTAVPYEQYLEQWCSGTRPCAFLTELRKAKNPTAPGEVPTIFDRRTFDDWKTSWLDNAVQTKHERRRYDELQARHNYSSKPKQPFRRKFAGGKPQDRNQNKTGSANLRRDDWSWV